MYLKFALKYMSCWFVMIYQAKKHIVMTKLVTSKNIFTIKLGWPNIFLKNHESWKKSKNGMVVYGWLSISGHCFIFDYFLLMFLIVYVFLKSSCQLLWIY